MNYWDIVFMTLATIGVCMLLGTYVALVSEVFANGPEWLGWILSIALAAGLIFGLPAFIIAVS